MTTVLLRHRIAIVLLAAVGILSACGGGKADPAASQTAAAMSDDQIMTLVRQYGQCMRDHGVARFRDGTLEDGRLTRAGAPDGSVTEEQMRVATEACEHISAQLPASVLAPEPPPSAAKLEQMTRFSECVRQHGLPDWPDPDSRGAFKVTDPTVVKSDKFQAAQAACKEHYDGGIKLNGGSKK
ncbi:hypothetical protein ACFO1B_12955 [Dactylosporangium siamense]|uniref:Lipoprotein n=1 Tax=Dactylosporangium siamense TaxID=685454 RepID=A0A919UB68_9ACTN|nr:hypothetical protein [Dactylosporangium siamense]GIG49194.1 hypothetical protein Dsi01nite_072350 [Dactylosporangium siamense]